nr:aldehyde dehydrogenase (NADP(+)) [uncultured Cohaesibacter sp.]
MSYTPHGSHLIAGEKVKSNEIFSSAPVSGPAHDFSKGTPDLVAKACEAAEEAFWSYGYSSREERAAFLECIADEIEARAAEITETGNLETGLPTGRLEGERGRTTGQLRMFANHIRAGEYLDRRLTEALPDRKPLARPDLRLMQRPIGPVAVFGASNFPLAFSVAGGDTAAALAAGCPVVVKGHSAHPGTGEIVGDAVVAAVKKCGIHPGVFSLVQGGGREVGTTLVQHPLIKAVGFTGSFWGGKALFDLCVSRPEPIPFFGELGSVNPMFVLPEAVKARGEELGKGWAGSLSVGAGQFCTNPGLAIILEEQADAFGKATVEGLKAVGEQVMLTSHMADTYRKGVAAVASETGVRELLTSMCDMRNATPNLFVVSGADWLANKVLKEEVFGPMGIIVTAKNADEMLTIAKSFDGQLTATILMDDADKPLVGKLLPILERKAGRILANAFPTGVEVCDSMVHGGPFPASTNFGATSVGTMSIRRFLRPVCYQDIPFDVLPEDAKDM